MGNFVFVAGDGDVEPLGEEVSAGDRQQAVGGELPYGFVLPGKVFDGQGVGFQRQIVVGDRERRIERAGQLASQIVPHDSHLVGWYRFGSEPVDFGEYFVDEGSGKLGARLGGYRQVAAVPHGGDSGGNAIGVAFFFANVRHEPAAEVSAEYGAEVFQGEEVGVLPVYDGQTHANARLQGVLFVGNDDVPVRGLYGVAAGRLRGLAGRAPRLPEVCLQAFEQLAGNLPGDEYAAFVGSHVLAVVGSEVVGSQLFYVGSREGAAVGVFLAENHGEVCLGGEHIDFLSLHEQLLYAPFFEPVELFLGEVGADYHVGQQCQAGIEMPVEGVECHIQVVARRGGLQPSPVIVEGLGYLFRGFPGGALFEHEQGE